MWNVVHLEDERTNNRVEGNNHRLKVRLNGANANFWAFLRLMKTEISTQVQTFAHFTNGGVGYRRRNAAVQWREGEIQRLKYELANGTIEMVDFFTEMIKLV